MEHRRWWIVAAIVAVGVVVAALLLWGGDDDETVGSGETTTTEEATTTSTSTTASTTTTTAPPADTTTTTTTAAGPAAPGQVTGVVAGPGGGSTEVALRWNAVAGATGYVVLAAASPSGTFTVVAEVDVVAGTATVVTGIVNVYSAQHTYIPPSGGLTQPDTSPSFELIDTRGGGERCYQVRATNLGGQGPPSAIACGSPP